MGKGKIGLYCYLTVGIFKDVLQMFFFSIVAIATERLKSWLKASIAVYSGGRVWPMGLWFFFYQSNFSRQLKFWNVLERWGKFLWCYSNQPGHGKICLRGFRPSKTQSSLLSYRDQLESWSFGFSKYRYYTIYVVNNKGADPTVRMRRLICAFVVRMWHKQVFSWRGS